MAAVKRLGLTGGIGSGKSTVASMLAERGVAVIDADVVARSVTAPAGAAIPAIVAEFGQEFLAPDGSLHRDRMRALAFANPTARRRLESIVHPMVGAEMSLAADQAIASGCTAIVFDVPLLAESPHWRQRVDHVLVVDCGEETQVARVVARNGMAADAVRQIIAAQAPRAVRLGAADAVVYNDGLTLSALRVLVDQTAKHFGL
jgi:dephospho-CoA kinase